MFILNVVFAAVLAAVAATFVFMAGATIRGAHALAVGAHDARVGRFEWLRYASLAIAAAVLAAPALASARHWFVWTFGITVLACSAVGIASAALYWVRGRQSKL